jgi:cyclic pyranopterin phosphate synthase
MTMQKLTHLDKSGNARMVDVSAKADSVRTAVATGRIELSPDTIELIKSQSAPKGDVLAAARLAGIMAAKRTSDLIPLCHPLPVSSVAIDLSLDSDSVRIEARATVTGKTGVEMEALTAVAVSALTVYDMVKAVDKSAVITDIRLESKTGGKSGDYRRA